jgi:hypothetical protein
VLMITMPKKTTHYFSTGYKCVDTTYVFCSLTTQGMRVLDAWLSFQCLADQRQLKSYRESLSMESSSHLVG